MNFILFILLTIDTIVLGEIPYNWLSLATLRSSDYSPPLSEQFVDRKQYESLCSRLLGLNPIQKNICAQHPMAIPFVARGVREALYECQQQFKYERWNCSDITPKINTPYGTFTDILGRTLRSSSKEGAFLATITSAGLVHAVTKGCNTGNLTNCGCDTKPERQRFTDGDAQSRQQHFSWGGCSDNVPWSVKFARGFLDEWESKSFSETKNVSHLVMKHNHFAGREAIAQSVRRHCRCHGVSGSCEFKTCWLQMQKFSDVAQIIKKRYDNFAVQVEIDVTKRAKKRLRRKERTERQIPLRGNELAYVMRSPSYCERNDAIGAMKFQFESWQTVELFYEKFYPGYQLNRPQHYVYRLSTAQRAVLKTIKMQNKYFTQRMCLTGILGTAGRECKHGTYGPESCDLLCCGRGFFWYGKSPVEVSIKAMKSFSLWESISSALMRGKERFRADHCTSYKVLSEGDWYNTRMVRQVTQCHCKFVWCCQVKCKECIDDVAVHTCK